MAQLRNPRIRKGPIELAADSRFGRRVARLAWTSVIALGAIWWLNLATLESHWAIGMSLAGGWLLMPTILWLSLRWPRARYALILPATLVSLGLLGVCLTALPAPSAPRVGWLLVTGGVLLGGLLGLWFWFRWLPVPLRLHDPFSLGRWALVGVHVALILIGLTLLMVSLEGPK